MDEEFRSGLISA